MKINRLVLKDFRSYESLDLSFQNNLHIIFGRNGEGKSNLIEAINYLNLARSYRVKENIHLIRKSCPECLIKANFEVFGINKDIEIEIKQKGKRISINGNPIKKVSELAKLVNIILFIPEDCNLFKSSPSDRREFLDEAISKFSPNYLDYLSHYKSSLKQRNSLLKEEVIDFNLLEVYEKQLVELGLIIDEFRDNYVKRINQVLPNLLNSLRDDDSSIMIEFNPVFLGRSNEELLEKYVSMRNIDIASKVTNFGIQKEDFTLLFNEQDISVYGSQGENRLAALALKLAPYYLIDEDNKPIVILDDVLSELDEKHQENLLKLVKSFKQVFITSVNKINVENATYIEVVNHKAEILGGSFDGR